MTDDAILAEYALTRVHTAKLKAKLKNQVIGWLKRHPSAGPFAVMAALVELASEVGVSSEEHQLTIDLFRDLARTVETQRAAASTEMAMPDARA